jgi:hypothetical protein
MAKALPIRHHRPGQSIAAHRILVKVVFTPAYGGSSGVISAYFTIVKGATIEKLMQRAMSWLSDFLASAQQSTPIHDANDYWPAIAPTLGL